MFWGERLLKNVNFVYYYFEFGVVFEWEYVGFCEFVKLEFFDLV